MKFRYIDLGAMVGFIVTLIGSLVKFGRDTQRRDEIEKRLEKIEHQVGLLQEQSERIVRIETKLDDMKEYLHIRHWAD